MDPSSAPTTPARARATRGNESDAAIWAAWERFCPVIRDYLPCSTYDNVHDLLAQLDDGVVILAIARDVLCATFPGRSDATEKLPLSIDSEVAQTRWVRVQNILRELDMPGVKLQQEDVRRGKKALIASFLTAMASRRFPDHTISARAPTADMASPRPAPSAYTTRFGHGVPGTPATSSRTLAAAPFYAGGATPAPTPSRPPSHSIAGDGMFSASMGESESTLGKVLRTVFFGSDKETKGAELQQRLNELMAEREMRNDQLKSLQLMVKGCHEELNASGNRIRELEANLAEVAQLRVQYNSSKSELTSARNEIAEVKAQYDANLAEMASKFKAARDEVEAHQQRIADLQAEAEAADARFDAVQTAHADALAAAAHEKEDVAAAATVQAAAHAAEVESIHARMNEMSTLIESLNSNIDDFKAQLVAAEQERNTLILAHAAAIAAMEARAVAVAQEHSAHNARFQSALTAVSTFGAAIKSLRVEMASSLSTAAAEFATVGQQLVTKVAAAESAAAAANTRYVKEQAERRRLFNKLQEARGNIRVLARVRPLLGKEVEAGETAVVRNMSTYELVVNEGISERAGGRTQDSKAFEFDHVFGAESSQSDVFDEVTPLVTSAMDGFHACIFAYGQTGSGKTFTMGGAPSAPGVYRRSLDEMFALRDERAASYTYTVKVSMVEIYNEAVMDLLSDAPAASSAPGAEDESSSLEIKQGPHGNFLPDATIVSVSNVAEVEEVMAKGALNRTVGRTNANEHSSRSHSLLMIDIYGHNFVSDARTYGRLVLVDLAGSERVSKSGAEGQRLKEAQNINKSLSALGDVIQALSQKAPHVPFRNSKLTWLLADSLGKENKTLMIVQVSPVASSRQETICSLTFASRVRRVELGKATKHADVGEVGKLKNEIKRLQDIQRSVATESAALHESLHAAEEAEASSKAKLAEAQARISKLEVDLSTREEAAKEADKLRGEVARLSATVSEKSNVIEKLTLELRDAVKSTKSAASAAADASSARMDANIKRAVDDTETRMKIERSRALTELEAKFKAEVAALRKSLKEAQAGENKAKAELIAADAKAKADVNAAVVTAKATWERESRRATIAKSRQSAAFGRKMSLRKSTANAAAAAAACADAEAAAVEAEVMNTSATSATSEALDASMASNATSALDHDASYVHDDVIDADNDGSVHEEASIDDGAASIGINDVFLDDVQPVEPIAAVPVEVIAPVEEVAVAPVMVDADAPAAAAWEPTTPNHVDIDDGAAIEPTEEAEADECFVPAVALFGKLDADAPAVDENADADAAIGASSVTIAAAPIELEAGAVKMGSRERARMLGLASPKPVGILKAGGRGVGIAVAPAASAAARSARVALLSPNSATVMIPGAPTPAARRDAGAATPSSKRPAPPTPGRMARSRVDADEEVDAENVPSFIGGGGARSHSASTGTGAAGRAGGSNGTRAASASAAATRAGTRGSKRGGGGADSVDEPAPTPASAPTEDTGSVLRPAGSAANVLAGMKIPAGMKLAPGAKVGTAPTAIPKIASSMTGGATRVKAPAAHKTAAAAVRGPTRVSVYEAAAATSALIREDKKGGWH